MDRLERRIYQLELRLNKLEAIYEKRKRREIDHVNSQLPEGCSISEEDWEKAQ